ncbi:Ankyrin repeat-containing protein, partial [Cynara cardunculus var. scolymus]
MNTTSGKLRSVELNVISQHQINIPSAPSQSLPLNLPCQDLLDGRSEEYLRICFPLYKASMKGDWEAGKDILDKHKEVVRFSINTNFETALHVAVYKGNTLFVKNLVAFMENKDMELQNSSSNTALCLAAVAGHVEMAEILVNRNKTLLDIAGSEGKLPLYMATLSGKHDMVKYLYENSKRMTGNFWTHTSRGCVLLSCVEAGLFDVALQIVNDSPELAINSGECVLRLLAPQKYKGFVDEENQALKLLKVIWANIEKLPKPKIDDILRGPADEIKEDENQTAPEVEIPKDVTRKYSSRILFVAAKMGNVVFILELIRQHPERVLELNDNNQSIFHIAVSYRHDYIYSLMYEIGSVKDSIVNLEDVNGNNMLHLVGILRETTESNELVGGVGALLQMRQDLIWFQEVKRILPVSFQEKKNTAGLSPCELFNENHKVVASTAEEWVKKISSELMLVAVLIVTISFAASITFAGGYNQVTGLPMFYKRKSFGIFTEASRMSFMQATISIFVVLSIIISRYGRRDFMRSIPMKISLVIGSLSMSMMNMVVAYFCNSYLLIENKDEQVTTIIETVTWILSQWVSV